MHRDQQDETGSKSPPESPQHGGQPRLTAEQREKILRLRKCRYGMRRIAACVGCDRKSVRKILQQEGLAEVLPPVPKQAALGKLDGFKEQIEELASKGLKVPRILREIRERGYFGGRTIVADYARRFRPQRSPKKVRRRFETRPGEEMQVDWSPYRVPIAGKVRTVHAFGAVLHHSRKGHVRFYENDRQSTLLEAHVHAFEDFDGVTQRVVYDRMATVVLGRITKTGEPIWHPRFLAFAKHYGYEPYLCRVKDPDRKGGVEAMFGYLEHDFVAAASFDSLEEMNDRVRQWLDEVANARVHGTTRNVPHQAWLVERGLLIALPDAHYPVFDEERREVGEDTTLWIRGTPYTVPWEIANSTVAVRLYHGHFEVLASDGRIALRRSYASGQDKGKLQIDPRHHEGMPRRPDQSGRGTARRLEERLLARFPTLAELVDGIKRRMKSLAHTHLRILLELATRHGDDAFVQAAEQALRLRSCNAHTVKRLLERTGPPPPPPIPPLTRSRSLSMLADEVDSGSLEDYAELDPQEEQEGRDEP